MDWLEENAREFEGAMSFRKKKNEQRSKEKMKMENWRRRKARATENNYCFDTIIRIVMKRKNLYIFSMNFSYIYIHLQLTETVLTNLTAQLTN